MQGFFNRLRSQSTSQRHSESSRSKNADAPSSSTTGAGTPAQPEVVTTETPAAPFTGLRKIAPNQDALLASSQVQDSQQPVAGSRRAGTNELGVRVPSALARVANRKVTPTTLPTEDTIRESTESEGPQPITSTQPPEDISTSRRSFGLSSLASFTTPQTWSTFGRSRKDKQLVNNASDDKPGGPVATPVSRTPSQSRTRGGVTVSRTSSKSTPNRTRTQSTKSGGLSRSNSTKQPVPSLTEHQHSRTLSTSNENNDNNTEGGSSPTQEQKGLTPSTPSTHPSIFKSAPTAAATTTTTIPHEPIDATYPPRSTAVKKEEQPTASSLPFTFGRQPPTRPLVEDVFISEFGTSDPTEEKNSPTDKRGSSGEWASKSTFGGSPKSAGERARLSLSTEHPSPGSHSTQPFPILETSFSDNSVGRSPNTSRPHNTSGSSSGPPGSIFGDNVGYHPQLPSLVSDIALHSEISSSSGLGTDIPLRNMASFASSGDELANPHAATSSWVNSSTSNSRFEFGIHTQETTVDEAAERMRSASGSSSSRTFIRRTSSAKRLNSLQQAKKKSIGSLPTIVVPPITVFPAHTTVSSQAFPRHEIPPIITTPTPDQASSQQASEANQGGQGASSAEAVGSGSSRIEPPVLAVTAPTPRPSPARSQSNRLSDLFLTPRVPHGHAHASGIGVAGVEPRSRQQSIKVMGKRKAGDAESEDPHDDRSRRPRFDSNAPSSYHRKRMKLSNASELDASPLRTPGRASMSGAPSIRSLASSRPGTGVRRAFSRNASSVSIPVSAILTPRAPSVHRPLSIASRSSVPNYNNPLRNRVQRRSKREDWIDSWTLDREEMPIQAWLFLAGFLFPPCWWIAIFIPIAREEEKEPKQEKGKGKDIEENGKRKTRSASASDSAFWAGERTARLARERMWRFRCLIASIISTIIYIPIIACAAVFARK